MAVLALFVIVFFVLVIALIARALKENGDLYSSSDSDNSATDVITAADMGCYEDTHPVGDEEEFKIVGVSQRGLTRQDIGFWHDGWLVAERNNPYDKNAVMVMTDKMKHVGYISREDNKVFTYILKAHGGRVKARGFIGTFQTADTGEIKYYGRVFYNFQ